MEFEGRCHYCNGDMLITETKCKSCGTIVKGEFEICDFCKLSQESKQFIRVFIECDGNIKNVEKELGISYPTVKSRLSLVQEELKSLSPSYYYENSDETARRKKILRSIEVGEISVEDGLRMLDTMSEE